MINYELEPLIIELNAPKGKYEVIVTVKAEGETVFSVYEKNAGCVADGCKIANASQDITFITETDQTVIIKIYCDGSITATAMASYIGE